jgi:translin
VASVPAGSNRRQELSGIIEGIDCELARAYKAREVGLAACRRTIRASGSSIRAVHRHQTDRANELADDAERALREAQEALEPFPALVYAGFLHDAEKEYAEARLTASLVVNHPLPSPAVLGVDGSAWMRGLAEAASELRRYLLDRLRAGDLDVAERLLESMDDVYDALQTIDYPDAITSGLRRTIDGLRAVLERTRGDMTTTVLQAGLRGALEQTADQLRATRSADPG